MGGGVSCFRGKKWSARRPENHKKKEAPERRGTRKEKEIAIPSRIINDRIFSDRSKKLHIIRGGLGKRGKEFVVVQTCAALEKPSLT